MSNYKFIVLDIQPDYPLKNVMPNIYYRLTVNKEENRHASFFITQTSHTIWYVEP